MENHKKIIKITDNPNHKNYLDNYNYSFTVQINSFEEGYKIISIPKYLEKNSKYIKDEYLSFIHNLGTKSIKYNKLFESNILDNQHYFWWQSLFSQKANFSESKGINKVLKIWKKNCPYSKS